MSSARIRGRLSVHPRGFGFVQGLDGGPRAVSLFVPPPALGPFLSGDIVEATAEEGRDGRFSATDLELVERWRTELLGRVVRQRRRNLLKPDPQVSNRDWVIDGLPEAGSVDEELWVVARLRGDSLEYDRAVPLEDVGLTAVIVRWGIRAEYPEECLAAAEQAELDRTDRRDLRDVPTVTIDSPHSRDLDDALAVLPAQDDGAVRILVLIADVDSVVLAGSALDQEARARCTSVYLPGHVIPMLPPSLSEKALSLLPERERAVLACELRIDPDGEVTAVDLAPALIRSDARLSYQGVSAYLDEGDPSGIPEQVRSTVRWLRTAAARISAARASRGGVSLERDEVKLVIDPDSGEPESVEARQLTSAHRLVERLMVAANEAVARWLVARGLPGLYRVQDEPDPERVRDLAEFATNFGFETAFGERLTPRALAAFEEQFETSTVGPQVRTVLRRVLGRARYTVHPAPHFGLAAPLYLHFTSPIRRYPDLVVHRVVKAHLAGQRDQQAGDPKLEAVAQATNEAAFRARKAETERHKMLIARLFAGRIGETFAGHIIAVKPFGLVVQLMGPGVTGTVPARSIPGGRFEFDEATETLRGKAHSFVVGQRVDVEVTGADEGLGRVELELR